MIDRMFDLTGKAALVTGGSSGIGLALAGVLARAGAKVAIVNRNADRGRAAAEELQAEGLDVRSFRADVRDSGQVEAAVAEIEAATGPVDILVNSHGVNHRQQALEFSDEDWGRIIDINLTGVFNTCRAVGRRMVARGEGRVINVSSVAARIGLADRAPYCASKGGVTQLTRALALEWARHGITVNAIGPGFIHTPLIEPLLADPGFQDRVKAAVPLGRIGEPVELGGMVLLLASEAGSYITGQTIYIDGGWTAV